jgi:transposase
MGRDVKMDVQLDVSREGYAGRLDVIAGPTGRQHRTDVEKARIAAESLAPGAIVADIARRHGATRWQIYDWRRRFRSGRLTAPEDIIATPAFVPLDVDDGARMESTADIIEVAIGDVLIRVGRDASEAHLAMIFRAVRAAS